MYVSYGYITILQDTYTISNITFFTLISTII